MTRPGRESRRRRPSGHEVGPAAQTERTAASVARDGRVDTELLHDVAGAIPEFTSSLRSKCRNGGKAVRERGNVAARRT